MPWARAAWPNRARSVGSQAVLSAICRRLSPSAIGDCPSAVECRAGNFAERHHAVPLQVFAELEHRHVVRFAKPGEEIGLLECRGNLLFAARLRRRRFRGVAGRRRRSGPCSDWCRPAARRGNFAPPRAPNANAAANRGPTDPRNVAVRSAVKSHPHSGPQFPASRRYN